MMVRVKNIQIKDFYGAEMLAKIPKFLWNHTVGQMCDQLNLSLKLKGLGKLELLRTLYTGRSSQGHLWSHADGGFGAILPTAWTPSLRTLGAVGLITGAEFAMNGKDSIHSTEGFINYANANKGEFANNYFL
jgi:hypothetical protein